jgi:hypothetical protein
MTYTQGEEIVVTFNNASPGSSDRIGLYSTGDALVSENEWLWVRTCGTQTCSEQDTSAFNGKVVFGPGRPFEFELLGTGKYVMHLLRKSGLPTFESVSRSAEFTIVAAFPAAAPRNDALREFTDFLANVVHDNGATLNDPESPQSRAAKWLFQDTGFSGYSGDKKLQRYALATLYYSTGGNNWSDWSGWLSESNECSWQNGKNAWNCDGSGMLTSLDLQDQNLIGSIPPELTLLSNSLVKLILSNNKLYGPIPTQLGAMKFLNKLQMTRNDLTGGIPTEMGLMANLKILGLGRNRLIGSLPNQWSKLQNLNTLGVERNSLTGTIPTSFGQMESLAIAHFNSFSGQIPHELGGLVSISELSFRANDLTGAVPMELCELNPNLNADCAEVSCSCCTYCCTDRTKACVAV